MLCFETNLLTAGNYESVRVQLQNSEQLQDNSVNGALLITINRVINYKYQYQYAIHSL